MPLHFNLEGDSLLTSGQLSEIAQAISHKLSITTDQSIGIAFVTQLQIRKLNKEYAGNDYATDVLSFDYGESGSVTIQSNIGDIVICKEIAKKQAGEYGVNVESELALLTIHGSLHILGYDHQTKSQGASLDRLQGDIMKTLNYKYRDFKWSH